MISASNHVNTSKASIICSMYPATCILSKMEIPQRDVRVSFFLVMPFPIYPFPCLKKHIYPRPFPDYEYGGSVGKPERHAMPAIQDINGNRGHLFDKSKISTEENPSANTAH